MPPVGYKAQVIAAMPGTVPEIMARSGMTKSTVKRWITLMREAGECHIDRWIRPDGPGGFMPVHIIGEGKDARCHLKAFSGAHYSKKSRRKAKEEGKAEFTQARRSAQYYAKKATAKPHDWLHALR